MTSHIFADRILNIAVTGPVVRIELGSMRPPTSEGQKPQMVPTETLVMPLEGLATSFSMLDTLMKKLVADGVLQVKPVEASTASNAPAPRTKQ